MLNPGEGPDQAPRADAKIARFASKPEWAFAVAELTPAYAEQARRVERGVALADRRHVMIQDEIEAEAPVDLWWFMHTPASVAIDADGRAATLEQGQARLLARILTPAEARFEVRPAEPLPSSPNPEGQRRNRDVRKLAIHLPKTSGLRLTVVLTPVDEQRETAWTPDIKPLADW